MKPVYVRSHRRRNGIARTDSLTGLLNRRSLDQSDEPNAVALLVERPEPFEKVRLQAIHLCFVNGVSRFQFGETNASGVH